MPIFLRRDQWLLVGGLFILSGSLISAYFLYSSWLNSKTITLPIPECDLRQGPCSSTLPTGEQVELRIKNTHMPILTSLQLEVKTQRIPVEKMFISFKGVEMNMGEYKYTLYPQKGGIYTTKTILPTCMQESMLWHATIHIETSHKNYAAPFILVNQRPEQA